MWINYIEKMDKEIVSSLQRQCDIFDAAPRDPSIDRLSMVPYAVDNFYYLHPLPDHCFKPTYITRFKSYNEATYRLYNGFEPYIEYDTGDSRADCSSDEPVDEEMPTFP